ncbi:MAG: protein translocase subunit SecDF, partial [Lachnospiraceae bacterium]|nr:protein translocase subunit SecDF [Lachnospiraceae bacterium]
MKKGKAITYLLIFVLLLGGFGYLSAFGIGAEQTGSAAGINLGLDLAGGVSITYQVVSEETPSDEDMSDTVYKLQQRVEGYSSEAIVYREGSDRINIEIPGVSDANTILEELGKPGSLIFVNSAGVTVLEGTDVANAEAVYQPDAMGNSEPAVSLTLTAEGAVKFAEA